MKATQLAYFTALLHRFSYFFVFYVGIWLEFKVMKKLVLFYVVVLSAILSSFVFTSCVGAQSADSEIVYSTELAQQVGDFMAMLDEASGASTGTYNFVQSLGCAGTGLSACSNSTIIKNYAGCSSNGSTIEGSLTLLYTGTNSGTCQLNTVGDNVDVIPAFNHRTPENNLFEENKIGTYGLRIAYASGSGASRNFTVTAQGVRRIYKLDGTTKYDVSTFVPTAMTLQKPDRANRTLASAGTLRFQNSLTGEQCDLVPNAITWSATCTCAVSGSWSGTCQQTGTFNLTLNGCGQATVSLGAEEPKAIQLTRCMMP